MGFRSQLKACLEWRVRSDELTSDDARVSLLGTKDSEENFIELGYVAKYKNKFYWAVTNAKLPGKTSIAAMTRDQEKCCRQLRKFVVECMYHLHKAQQPAPITPFPYSLSELDLSVCAESAAESPDESFSSGFEYGIAYALQRLGLSKLPPDSTKIAAQNMHGAISYHKEMPERKTAYGTYEAGITLTVGSSQEWLYRFKQTR